MLSLAGLNRLLRLSAQCVVGSSVTLFTVMLPGFVLAVLDSMAIANPVTLGVILGKDQIAHSLA